MNNLNAILLVVAAMASFTVEDMFIKRLSAALPVGEILALIAIGSCIVFGIIAWIKGNAIFARRNWRPVILARAGTEAFAALSFATALSLVDISTVGAVFQSMPLVVTMGAALFLNESVGWRRWVAIVIGFVGVLMIIRPGLSGFEPEALWVLVAVLSVAIRDLMTRVMDAAVPSNVVSFQAYLTVAVASVAMLALTPGTPPLMPDAPEALMVLAGIVFGTIGYACIVAGMRLGDASAVTPFRYTRLVFTMLVGIVVFGERPDLMTYLGSALIIASGLYAYLRERKLARLSVATLGEEVQTHGF